MSIHADLASGRWYSFSLMEQLGNTGSEVSRALRSKEEGNAERTQRAFERALELLDLTIADPKHRGRLRELCRTREVLCDYFIGENEYRSSRDSLDRYFLQFGVAARGQKAEGRRQPFDSAQGKKVENRGQKTDGRELREGVNISARNSAFSKKVEKSVHGCLKKCWKYVIYALIFPPIPF